MTPTERMNTKQIILSAIETNSDDANLDDFREPTVSAHTLQRRLERIGEEPMYTVDQVEQVMARWRPSS